MAYKKNKRGSYILSSEDGSHFTVTQKEYKEIQTLVKRANQRRVDVAHRYYDNMTNANVMVGVEYESYMELLEKKGFITEKYTTRLNQFNSKDDVKSLLYELKQVTKRGYGKNRLDDIRYSMIERIESNYGSSGDKLIEKIKEMDKAELLSMYLMSDREIIEDIYGSGEDDEEIVASLASKTMAYINKLLKGSEANKMDSKLYKKGFRAYKNRKSKKTKKGFSEYKNRKSKKSKKSKRG